MQWIPTVTNNFPEPLIDVLIVYEFDDEPGIDLGYRRANGQWCLTGDSVALPKPPTYWMELPPLPEKSHSTAER